MNSPIDGRREKNQNLRNLHCGGIRGMKRFALNYETHDKSTELTFRVEHKFPKSEKSEIEVKLDIDSAGNLLMTVAS